MPSDDTAQEQPPTKRSRTEEVGGTDGDPPIIEEILTLGAQIWTASEGEALAGLKTRLPCIRSILQMSETHNVLRAHAALGPAWWMIGLAKEGRDVIACSLESRGKAFVGVADGVIPGGIPPDDEFPLDLPQIREAADLHDAGSSRPFLQGASDNLLYGCALDGAGMNSYAIADYADAWRFHASAYAAVSSESGVDAEVLRSRALDGLGRVARETGRYELAWHLHVLACKTAIAVVGPPTILRPMPLTCAANAISNAGVVRFRQKRHEHAKDLHRAALDLRLKVEDLRGVSSSQGNLALLLTPTEALPLYAESLAIREALGDIWGVAGSLRAMADTHQKLRQREKARECTSRAAAIFAEVRDNLGIAECLESLGIIDHCDSDSTSPSSSKNRNNSTDEAAATLLGAAVAVRRAINASVDVVMQHSHAASLKEKCPGAWSIAEEMTLDNARGLLLLACSKSQELSGFTCPV